MKGRMSNGEALLVLFLIAAAMILCWAIAYVSGMLFSDFLHPGGWVRLGVAA